MGSSGKAALVALLLIVGAAVVAVDVTSLSSGIARSGTQAKLPEAGCVCHGAGVTPQNAEAGTPSPAVVPFISFDPQPAVSYEPNAVYNVTVGILATDVEPNADARAAKMGFNIRVSEGEFVIPSGEEDFIQAPEGVKDELTHRREGDVRGENFTFQWTAPRTLGDPAVFTLFVNTVNGNAANDDGDHWNGLVVVIKGDPEVAVGAGAAEVSVRHLGVDWFAFYVGGVAFVFMFAVLFITYFVFKYGETVHTTDERDRPAEKKE